LGRQAHCSCLQLGPVGAAAKASRPLPAGGGRSVLLFCAYLLRGRHDELLARRVQVEVAQDGARIQLEMLELDSVRGIV